MTTQQVAVPISNDSVDIISATISVCICTYKRPELLKRTLERLCRQDTQNRFTYSVVVSDNDRGESARRVVSEFRDATNIEIGYCVEPEQNIALARNRALENAHADFVAFIDDDEFPTQDWLTLMLRACEEHQADGVLGPVKPFFDETPPKWIVRGKFCERPEHKTGLVLHWRQTRTGNVLFRRKILNGVNAPFRREFGNGGEDQDFFRRMMEHGHQFVWCNEAVVYEVVPEERCNRSYFLKRAILRGQNEKLQLNAASVVKSLIAIPFYLAVFPFAAAFGEHEIMKCAVRFCDHAGKLLVAMGIKPIRGKYLDH